MAGISQTSQKDSGTNQPTEQKSTANAAHVALTDTTTGLPLGMLNSGVKVANVYDPARDIYLDFYFGADDALSAALTAAAANNGLWLDQSYINPKTRSIVIVNGNAAPSFSYLVQFSRNGLSSTTDDTYTAVASAASTTQITQVLVPDTKGFDLYSRLVITPDAGQVGTQLTFKAYLIGRGG